MNKRHVKLISLICVVLIVGISLLINYCGKTGQPPKGSTFSIHFIDVGQADAALVECDGHYMLIDGGNKGDSDKIYSVLKKAGVPKLDIVVGTHAHEDHIGGLPGAFSYTTADLTLCPVTEYESEAFEDFARYAKEKGGGITVPEVNDTHMLGSAKITILAVNTLEDTNNTSIVLRIDYGKTSFLFMGDAETPTEEILMERNADLSATVLKVGHHGSETSSSYRFLNKVGFQHAVISVGKDNAYGHPDPGVLDSLHPYEYSATFIHRTDLNGDIFCTSNGTNVTFTTERLS